MKGFILNCYFVFYNLSYTKPSLQEKKWFWYKALLMLTVPIFTGIFFSVVLLCDAIKIDFQISYFLMLVLGLLTFAFLDSLLFNIYKIDKQENGTGLNIFTTKTSILQAVLLYVIGFSLMLIRTQIHFGSLVKH